MECLICSGRGLLFDIEGYPETCETCGGSGLVDIHEETISITESNNRIAAAVAEAVTQDKQRADKLAEHVNHLAGWLENWTLAGKTMTGSNDKVILRQDIEAAKEAASK